jgi:hypothetical protein
LHHQKGLKMIRIFMLALIVTLAGHQAHATNCQNGYVYGPDGSKSCAPVKPAPVAVPSPTQSVQTTVSPLITGGSASSNSASHASANQGQSLQNTITTGGATAYGAGGGAGGDASSQSAGGQSDAASSVSAPLSNQVSTQDHSSTRTLVLPAPAMAAQLPGGFCTTGKSRQFSILGFGIGSSDSIFDAANYQKCIALAEAMRAKTPQELAVNYCMKTPQTPLTAIDCVAAMMQALQGGDAFVAPIEASPSQPVVQPQPVSITVAPVFYSQPASVKPKNTIKHQKQIQKSSCPRIDPACQTVMDACQGFSLSKIVRSCAQ